MKVRCALIAVLLVAGCASQPKVEPAPRIKERVVLLPSDTDRPSAVVVTAGDREVVLATPYSSAGVRDSVLESSQLTEEEVKKRYAGLLSAQPRKPEPFTMYFELAGWDVETGVPRRETLEEVGLGWLADEAGAQTT